MATTTEPVADVEVDTDQCVELHGISWEFYESLVDAIGDHQRVLTAYSEGTLEMMSPSKRHDRIKYVLGRMIEALAEEFDLNLAGYGSSTWRRPDLKQGIEPDECFYIQNEESARSENIDLTVDPPPDLAVEVLVSRTLGHRLKIYATLGVPQVWRYRGQTLKALVLETSQDGERRYVEMDTSPTFPGIPLSGIAGFIERRGQSSNRARMREFRQWVQAQRKPS